jgi:L-malate glycosyltransferase
MHILIIPYVYPNKSNPSAGVFVKEQAMALVEKGLKVGVISIELKKLALSLRNILPNKEESVENGVFFYKKTGLNYLPKLPYYQMHAWAKWMDELFMKYIKKHGRPDLIHAHFGLWAGYAANYLSQKHQIPFVLTEHSTYLAEQKFTHHELKLHKRVYKNASSIITVSEGLKKEVTNLVQRQDINVIPNIIDTNKFKPSIKIGKDYFFSLGNLIPQKGFDILIEAFAGFSEKHPDYKLIIGGKGFQEKDLKLLVRKLKLTEKVVFVGALSQNEVISYMQAAKAFVLPSRHETFGVVFAEALACGTPVIATKCGGPEEYVDAESGYICSVGNVKEVVDAMLSIVKRTFNKETLHQKVQEKFSKEVVTDKIIDVYQSLLKNK